MRRGTQYFRLTLLHSERPKLYGVLAVLSAIGLGIHLIALKSRYCITLLIKNKAEDYTTVISFFIDSMALSSVHYVYLWRNAMTNNLVLD